MIREDNPEFYGPYGRLTCRRCGFEHLHQCTEDLTRDRRTWLRIVIENLWEFGWRVEISEGGMVPIGYGLAWHEWCALRIVVLPVPFNVIIRGLRQSWCWMMAGGPWPTGTVQDRIDAEVSKRIQRMKALGGVRS